MGIKCDIEWCDSSSNGQMGCAGCELWQPAKGVKKCYAGTLTERYAGSKGWPERFDLPVIFPDRITQACNWPDLTGKDRPEKPWLDKLPRLIFLDDMGDTWTEGLNADWLAPYIPAMEAAPHLWLTLTKRPVRARRAAGIHGWPRNFVAGTSVTSQATIGRVKTLQSFKELYGATTFVSVEPLWGPVDLKPYLGFIDWVIVGGESGATARPTHPDWFRSLRDQCLAAGVAFFFKQWGEYGAVYEPPYPVTRIGRDEVCGLGRIGKKTAGRVLDGKVWSQMPAFAARA